MEALINELNVYMFFFSYCLSLLNMKGLDQQLSTIVLFIQQHCMLVQQTVVCCCKHVLHKDIGYTLWQCYHCQVPTQGAISDMHHILRFLLYPSKNKETESQTVEQI